MTVESTCVLDQIKKYDIRDDITSFIMWTEDDVGTLEQIDLC